MDHERSDLCRCCEPPVPAAPVAISNRPGLPAIAYRIGTFATFRAAMLDALHDQPGLEGLTTRDSDDYSITVLELWAAVADVLTFYQERIANEAYLRTAVHRDSVQRLARLLDYRLRPGLAAETRLAFTIDPNQLPGKSNTARIPAGVKVMSVPGQDEQPQFFETVEEITGDARLNALWALPVPRPVNPFAQGTTAAALLTRPDRLATGDPLLFFNAGRLEEKRITALDNLDTPVGRKVQWEPAIQHRAWVAAAAHAARLVRRLRFFGVNASTSFQYYDPGQLSGGVWSSQPRWRNESVDLSFAANASSYPLDAQYEDLKPGMQLLVDTATEPDPLRLAAIVEVRQARASLHDKHPQQDTVTQLTLTRVIRDAPVVLSRDSNRLDVFARSGTDSALFLERTGSTWQGWEPLGGILASGMAAAAWASNRLDIFVRGVDGALYQRWRDGATGGTWQPGSALWKSLGGVLTSPPSAVSLGVNRLDVFVRGADSALWHRWWNGTTWSGWQWFGGRLTSRPVAVAWGPNRLDVFARGPDNALWHRCWDGSSLSAWQSLGGQISPDFCVAARAANRLDVFARALDGTLQTIGWNGSLWSAWQTLAPEIAGTPAVASWGANRLDVFARRSDATLMHVVWNGSAWSAPTEFSGKIGGDPAAVSWGTGRIDLFARGLDGGLQHSYWDGSRWLPWEGLGLGLGRVDDRRAASLYQVDPQELVFREFEYPAEVAGSRITVPLSQVDSIDKKRTVLLQAPPLAPHVATVTGSQPIASTPGAAPDHLAIDFTPELPAALRTGAAQLLGNAARATHGQSIAPEEILGDGNAAAAFQRFTLRHAPLTHLSSSKQVQGVASLSVLVNGARWTEVDSLYGQSASARVYVLRQDDDGRSTVQFGDGVTGARLPSGRGNVKAQYRYGLGLAGRVREKQLSVALTRPVGAKEVSNPAAAEGGADPEPRDAARIAAPTTVRTFGRAVALSDFETIAMASGEVAKASATWVWQTLQKAVHLTVAAQDGAALSAEALARLHAALDQARDPNHPLLLGSFCRVPVTVQANLIVDDAYVRDDVVAAARQALIDFFAFDHLALARSIHRSDIYAVLQAVPGLTALDLNVFHYKGHGSWSAQQMEIRGATSSPLQPHLRMFGARASSAAILHFDRIVGPCLAGATAPAVLPAEQAWLEDPAADLYLTATGGIG
jgi:hypothetical protein